MILYSFYIFDRHTECIYSRKWNTRPISASTKSTRPQSGASITSNGDVAPPTRKALSKEDDAKLIFGLVFSLRNMAQKLGGEDDSFLCYRTGEYKLHYYETPTRLKFVMLTDHGAKTQRSALHQIWALLYVEYVVKNPLSPVEHPGGIGVANVMFEQGLDAFVERVVLPT
ncbi:trafficking protein particle complex 1 [Lophium mytilinum]|uniref:Trafficking protein particle complex subunit n=1 Tax=Lophium mytilinum TaxID=390894 RepID=A0A6A6QE18_9PEZI|nr:trafficking protein particle complex 1 [Lophium mytilinum]